MAVLGHSVNQNDGRSTQDQLDQYARRSGLKREQVYLAWQPDALPDERYPGWGPQTEFLVSDEDFVYMDGGKGSGKSELLVMDCLKPEKINNARWHGVIFRREYKRLTEVIDRAKYWIGKFPQLHGVWNGEQSRFNFPSGAWLAFHNVENLGDEEKYQGWEITDLKFDQLEEIAPSQFWFLVMQNRTSGEGLKATCKWTMNPLGKYHVLVKKMWVDPFPLVTENTVRHSIGRISRVVDGREYTKTVRRIFTTVYDNPYYRRHQEYISTLAMEPDVHRRKAFFRGDWDVTQGQFFNTFSSEVHVIPARPLPRTWRRLAGLDYGNVKVMEFLCRDYLDNVYCEYEFRSEPTEELPSGETATVYAEKSAEFMIERGLGQGLLVAGDHNMWVPVGKDVGTDRTPAKIIQSTWNEIFGARGLKPPVLIKQWKKGSEHHHFRIACNEAVRDGLAFERNPEWETNPELPEFKRPPKIYFFDRCRSITSTLPALSGSKNDPLDIADGQDDHDFDAFKGPYMMIRASEPEVVEMTALVKHERYVEAMERQQVRSRDWRVDW